MLGNGPTPTNLIGHGSSMVVSPNTLSTYLTQISKVESTLLLFVFRNGFLHSLSAPKDTVLEGSQFPYITLFEFLFSVDFIPPTITMNSSRSQPAPATMASMTSVPDTADGLDASRNINGTILPNGHNAPPSATAGRTPGKCRHVAAVHWKPRTSCLSHDSEANPSFLGFRNLMVIVLSGFSPNPGVQVPVYCVRSRFEADKRTTSSCYESTTGGGELYEGMPTILRVTSKLTSALVRSIDLYPMP